MLITVFMFYFVSGLGTIFVEPRLSATGSFLSALPILLIIVLALTGDERKITANKIEIAAFLLVVAGIALLPLQLYPSPGAVQPSEGGSILFSSGMSCFMMLTFYFVAAIGAQNPMGSFSTAALTLAASWVGIGVGAAIGGILVELALDPAMIAIASAISLFMLVSYQTTALSQFDFDVFITRIVPIDGNGPGKSVAAAPASARMDASLSSSADDAESHDTFESSRDEIDAQCESISETYGLTKREREVLPLLAHGRTSPIIQRELVITQNTVKSHVRHIYAKLGVHSQQELIDLVISSANKTSKPTEPR